MSKSIYRKIDYSWFVGFWHGFAISLLPVSTVISLYREKPPTATIFPTFYSNFKSFRVFFSSHISAYIFWIKTNVFFCIFVSLALFIRNHGEELCKLIYERNQATRKLEIILERNNNKWEQVERLLGHEGRKSDDSIEFWKWRDAQPFLT